MPRRDSQEPPRHLRVAGDDPDAAAPARSSALPLAETVASFLPSSDGPTITTELPTRSPLPRGDTSTAVPALEVPVLPGETLQFVHYARRGDTLLITGVTPHGRRLTFEQREDRQGWYVVAAGRRRRPTEREMGLVVATITQEMEGGLAPERQGEVRSAYRLAAASDQPGLPVQGLEAYRDLLLDEAARFTEGQIDKLMVVSVDYQGFKRFANRHGHRIGAAFVQALGERLADLCADEEGVHAFHKSGKSFRVVAVNRAKTDIRALIDRITSEESRTWLVQRVWGEKPRTHPDEVCFHIGIASTTQAERDSDYVKLAQFLSDNAYRASKLGQLSGHSSIAIAKSDYRTTVYEWGSHSEDALQELAFRMDDGPAEVMAEMADYLHELKPADLEGMAVAGDLNALLYSALARDGFWQGTTAMRIACSRLVGQFLNPDQMTAETLAENRFVGGFDLGDEFYGLSLEGEQLYFIRGDINSAGATRVKAGLEAVHRAVGWRRRDGRGIVGRFLGALEGPRNLDLLSRLRFAAQTAFEENDRDPDLHVNDVVDIGDFLYTQSLEPITETDLVEGSELLLVVGSGPPRKVLVQERRTAFTLRLEIDGVEHPAVFAKSANDLQIKLRLRETVASAAIAVLVLTRTELLALLDEIREDNDLSPDAPMDIIGFLRHITDILLEEQVKRPAKVGVALGQLYSAEEFVRAYTLEAVREDHPGLFYEAVHQDLLDNLPAEIDRELRELVGHTMLSSARPWRTDPFLHREPTA